MTFMILQHCAWVLVVQGTGCTCTEHSKRAGTGANGEHDIAKHIEVEFRAPVLVLVLSPSVSTFYQHAYHLLTQNKHHNKNPTKIL